LERLYESTEVEEIIMDSKTIELLKDRAERFLSSHSPPYKLDLACGKSKREGFIGIDILPLKDVDVIWDLETFPWPFPDNSVSEIYCSHFVEHTENLIKIMNEIYRICKHSATVHIVAPYYTSIGAWQDPTHKRAISEMTFLYFDKNWRQQSGLTQYPIYTDIRGKVVQYAWDKRLVNASQEEKDFAQAHYWNVIAEIGIIMSVFKEVEKEE
jgi:predicted SAM-dependent methyltransferase